jgi:hypothetical protein
MANNSVKLVDHTNTPHGLQKRIKIRLQELFEQVFHGTPDKVTVEWGSGVPADAIVIHFVENVDHSYIRENWGGAAVDEHKGGHTRLHKGKSGSEIYKLVLFAGSSSRVKPGAPHDHDAYAIMAFHESFHNQLPYRDIHDDGGGGLADEKPHLPMTTKNIELMRNGLAGNILPQLL